MTDEPSERVGPIVWLMTRPMPYLLIAVSMFITSRQVWRMEPNHVEAIEGIASIAVVPVGVVMFFADRAKPQWWRRSAEPWGVTALLGVLMVAYGWKCADFFSDMGRPWVAGYAFALMAAFAPMLTATVLATNAARRRGRRHSVR